MKKIFGFLAAASMLVCAESRLEAQYRNPVIGGFYPDPSVCRAGDDYYLVNSTFQYFPGVPVFHSKDLVNWEQIGNVLTRESQLPLPNANSGGGIYAPTIRYHEGMFYMITTNISSGGNFIVHASDPAGPWSDPVWMEMGGIDPSLFWDEDGSCWFTGTNDGAIWLFKIDPMTGRKLSEAKRIWYGEGGRYPEAPHIYKKDGWYYLMSAEGGTEQAHSEVISRSRYIDGPYESNPGNPILTHCNRLQQTNPIQGTGHADLVQATDGSWWLVCLAYRLQGGGVYHLTGRETYLAPVTWEKDGWPVVNGDGHIDLQMDVKTLPQVPLAPMKTSYDFACDKLGFEWEYLRKPEMSNYSYTGKALRLKASLLSVDDLAGSATFVCRRQQDPHFTATSVLSLSSAQSGDEAGMMVYQDAGSHYDVYLTKQGGRNVIQCRFRLNSIEHKTDPVSVGNASRVWLKITGGEYVYTLSYSTDGVNYKDISAGDVKYLSTEAAGGFTGVMVGLYAKKTSESSKAAADVYSFEYKALD